MSLVCFHYNGLDLEMDVEKGTAQHKESSLVYERTSSGRIVYYPPTRGFSYIENKELSDLLERYYQVKGVASE